MSDTASPTPAETGEPSAPPRKTMSIPGATVLGIGGMIGAGIFALLGEAGAVAGAAVWMSFLLGLVVTSLLAYVCVKLGIRYPSSGGLITYLTEGFGTGRLVGIASWLGYMAAMVIVCSMVAVSFGSYATSLFVGSDAASWWDNVFTTALLLAMVAINLVGATIVARAQTLIVGLVLASFAFFVALTLPDIDLDLLAFDGYPSFSKIVASVALTFFAYMGFNIITFTAGDLAKPSHDLPRAMTGALGITGLTYVLIALAVFGTLTVGEVVQYGPTAIAEAARPSLGDFGFTLMAATALLSTAGATNATLYASGNMTGMLAQVGAVPVVLRPGLAPRCQGRAARHGRRRARRRQLRRPLGDRLRRQRHRAGALPDHLRRSLQVAREHRQQRRDDRAGDAGDGGRARRLLDRHDPQRTADVHGDAGDRRARRPARRRLARPTSP
ncbi:MAG: APC family permease [Gaiella sp.]|nr:APC family permease [Gaiella sp.]